MSESRHRKGISRRGFLGSALAAGAAFSVVPRRVLGGQGHQPPSETLNKAVIGVGGMGQSHVQYPGEKLLAICDVDKGHLQSTLEKVGGDVDGYHDFREVIVRPDIDIVHVVTPPHWHAIISIAAAEAGKDVWSEKPMSHSIGEGQKVQEAVQKNGCIFRLNTWFRFRSTFYGFGTPVKPIKKLADSGMLGWPLKVTINESNGFSWKLTTDRHQGRINVPPEPVPDELDYDFWLGPAPYKPYFRHRTHRSFRGYWDDRS